MNDKPKVIVNVAKFLFYAFKQRFSHLNDHEILP